MRFLEKYQGWINPQQYLISEFSFVNLLAKAHFVGSHLLFSCIFALIAMLDPTISTKPRFDIMNITVSD